LKVEAVEFVASLLGIHYVFIDDECGAFGIVGNSLANLPTNDQYVALGGWWRGIEPRPNVPDRAKFAEEIKQLLWGDVVAIIC